MTRLKTFVHVSDLHIGRMDPTTDDAMLDAHAESWLRRWPWFDGYLGHAGDALRHLDSFFGALRRAEAADLIVTGDLTTVGDQQEFALAMQFLTGVSRFASGSTLGLGVPRALDMAITGNHDQWPGRRAAHAADPVMFGASGHWKALFPGGFPAVSRQPLRPGIELVLVRINSDEDVWPFGVTRLFARGRFDTQLVAARKLLGGPDPNEVRVLIMHHSPSWPGIKLGMSRRMRSALERFMSDVGIRVILTGHAHRRGGAVTPTVMAGRPAVRMEARCGTTTQRDTFPPGWTPRNHDPLELNTLLVHRLLEEPHHHTIHWEVEPFVRAGRGFAGARRHNIGGALGVPNIQVWP